MYFVNHRSWADFFVDGWVKIVCINGRDMITGCSYLSRMAVIFAFPSACLCGYLNQFIWFFKRKRGISREWFTHFFDENWKARYLLISLFHPKSGTRSNRLSGGPPFQG